MRLGSLHRLEVLVCWRSLRSFASERRLMMLFVIKLTCSSLSSIDLCQNVLNGGKHRLLSFLKIINGTAQTASV
jgi:hypothetical protein